MKYCACHSAADPDLDLSRGGGDADLFCLPCRFFFLVWFFYPKKGGPSPPPSQICHCMYIYKQIIVICSWWGFVYWIIWFAFCFFAFFSRVGPMIGLLLIALGTGGIKPCVSAFGGDQFNADQVCNTVSVTTWCNLTFQLYQNIFLLIWHLYLLITVFLHVKFSFAGAFTPKLFFHFLFCHQSG